MRTIMVSDAIFEEMRAFALVEGETTEALAARAWKEFKKGYAPNYVERKKIRGRIRLHLVRNGPSSKMDFVRNVEGGSILKIESVLKEMLAERAIEEVKTGRTIRYHLLM